MIGCYLGVIISAFSLRGFFNNLMFSVTDNLKVAFRSDNILSVDPL